MPSPKSSASPDLQSKLLRAAKRLREERLWTYRPYPKQLEHHQKGAAKKKRLLMAGNQLGKTEAGTAEDAFHLIGVFRKGSGRRVSNRFPTGDDSVKKRPMTVG